MTDPPAPGEGGGGDALTRYVDDLFVHEPALLADLRSEMERRDFPMIQVPARTGLLLELVVRAIGARRILEIGTLGGYSSLWMVRGMGEDGRIVTLEREPDHAALARSWIERAGEAGRIRVVEGEARDLLPDLDADAYDLVFIDADKEGYSLYLEHALRLLRPGGIVLADNALWRGRVADPEVDDAPTRGLRAFNRDLAAHPALASTILPVGDGVALGVKG